MHALKRFEVIVNASTQLWAQRKAETLKIDISPINSIVFITISASDQIFVLRFRSPRTLTSSSFTDHTGPV